MRNIWVGVVWISVLFTTIRICVRAWIYMSHVDFAVVVFMAAITILTLLRQQIKDGWI